MNRLTLLLSVMLTLSFTCLAQNAGVESGDWVVVNQKHSNSQHFPGLKLDLSKVQGSIVAISKDQNGTVLLQDKHCNTSYTHESHLIVVGKSKLSNKGRERCSTMLIKTIIARNFQNQVNSFVRKQLENINKGSFPL